MSNTFDVIVVGSGPAGYVCAIRCAQLGLRTACVEAASTLGGTCLNVGCIPSKALLESSHLYHKALHDMGDHGINVKSVSFSLEQMMKRKDGVVNTITKGVEYLFSKNKVNWLKGRACFKSSNVLIISKDNKSLEYKTKNVVVATGSIPIEIPTAKFDKKIVVDSTGALSFASVPKHLLVVGAGAIGLEMGSVWLRLGSKVTVVEALDKILTNMDNQISEQTQRIFEKQGMSFYLNSLVKKVEVTKDTAKVYYSTKDKEHILEVDKVLVAVGRKANISSLGLDNIGIKVGENNCVLVDSSWRTNIDNVYAIGDVVKGPMLAHKASDEGNAVAEIIAGKAGHVNYLAIPNIVYTWPEVASIGLSEEACKEQAISYRVGKFFYKANGRARAMGETDGMVKIIADKKTDRILGFHIVGAMASEMIAEAAIAFEYGASAEDIARSVHAHPTLSEIMKEAALDVDKRAIHS